MSRRLIVHIGMPRAGSSTLQDVLYNCRDRLAAHGLLYPVLSAGEAGSGDPAQVYNHKLLQQSARSVLSPGRFRNVHDGIIRQIAASSAPLVILSYEGWWDPASLPALQRTVTRICRQCPGTDLTVAAIVREPASFLLSLYKLDVLHGRTDAAFDDYWPRKLSDPRLRYGEIAARLRANFAEVVMADFESLSRDGRFVGNALAAFGAPDILRRSGLPELETYRSPGGITFSDAAVSMVLFAARQLGLRRLRARRDELIASAKALTTRNDLEPEIKALSIPLRQQACHTIAEATHAETEALTRITGLQLPAPEPAGQDGTQTIIATASPLGKALRAALNELK